MNELNHNQIRWGAVLLDTAFITAIIVAGIKLGIFSLIISVFH